MNDIKFKCNPDPTMNVTFRLIQICVEIYIKTDEVSFNGTSAMGETILFFVEKNAVSRIYLTITFKGAPEIGNPLLKIF